MADSFGLKIGLEGEKEFKKALGEINQSFKVLGSEMKLVTAQYDANDTSIEALTPCLALSPVGTSPSRSHFRAINSLLPFLLPVIQIKTFCDILPLQHMV